MAKLKICSGIAAIGSVSFFAPELVPQRGEEERRGFARDPGDRQQDAGHYPVRGASQGHLQGGAPKRHPQGERCFAQRTGTIFNCSSVVRSTIGIMIMASANGAGQGRKPLHRHHQQGVGDHPGNDGRDAGKDVGREADDGGEPAPAVFGKVDGAEDPDRKSEPRPRRS